MLFELNRDLLFPPVHLAEPDGMLAYGGDLSVDRLLLAYKS
ncbi:MAG: leucyl/phenylalanyl-tRNA--protein transferase, partial [Spirochaetota bacterium]